MSNDNRLKLLTGFLVAGILIVGVGVWFLLNPLQRTEVTEKGQITIKLPHVPPIISEKLDFIMRGEFDNLYIYSDGSVIYIEEKGLRMPMPEHPPTRTWKLGKLNVEDLVSLISLFQTNEFNVFKDHYQYSGNPLDPLGSIASAGTMGDGSFTFTINYTGFQKEVVANGFLTPDQGETYPSMPYPLDEIYVKLRDVILNHTKEISTEALPVGGDE
jgi:hypothetical protein